MSVLPVADRTELKMPSIMRKNVRVDTRYKICGKNISVKL